MDDLDRLFSGFEEKAYRVETLSEYKIDNTNEYDEYLKFINGKQILGFANIDWINDLKLWSKENKTVKRLRVVPNPQSDYFKYEVGFCYPKNIEAHEEIKFIPLDIYKTLCDKYKLEGDFWLFDSKSVVVLLYDANGAYIDCNLEQDKTKTGRYLDFWHELESVSQDFIN